MNGLVHSRAPNAELVQRLRDEARPVRDETMLVRAPAGQGRQLADPLTEGRDIQIYFLDDLVGNLSGEIRLVDPLGHAVVTGIVLPWSP